MYDVLAARLDIRRTLSAGAQADLRTDVVGGAVPLGTIWDHTLRALLNFRSGRTSSGARSEGGDLRKRQHPRPFPALGSPVARPVAAAGCGRAETVNTDPALMCYASNGMFAPGRPVVRVERGVMTVEGPLAVAAAGLAPRGEDRDEPLRGVCGPITHRRPRARPASAYPGECQR
jgi:hypothetical protein